MEFVQAISNCSLRSWVTEWLNKGKMVGDRTVDVSLEDRVEVLKSVAEAFGHGIQGSDVVNEVLVWAVGGISEHSEWAQRFNDGLRSNRPLVEAIVQKMAEFKDGLERLDFYRYSPSLLDNAAFYEMLTKDIKTDELLGAIVTEILLRECIAETPESIERTNEALKRVCDLFENPISSADQTDLMVKCALAGNQEIRDRLINSLKTTNLNTTDEAGFAVTMDAIGRQWTNLSLGETFGEFVSDCVRRMLNGKVANTPKCIAIFHCLSHIFSEKWNVFTQKLLDSIQLGVLLRKYDKTPFDEYRLALLDLIGALCTDERGAQKVLNEKYPLLDNLINAYGETNLGLTQKKFDVLMAIGSRPYFEKLFGKEAQDKINKLRTKGLHEFIEMARRGNADAQFQLASKTG